MTYIYQHKYLLRDPDGSMREGESILCTYHLLMGKYQLRSQNIAKSLAITKCMQRTDLLGSEK